jgi:hypothetical protein
MRSVVTGPVTTTNVQIPTFEYGAGWERTPESELFLLAVTNMVSENTFYETASERDNRFAQLIHEVTKTNPAFIAGNGEDKEGFVSYLRNTMQMRSASIVMACEYAKAGGPNARAVIDKAISRGDEPGEALGYWLAAHGRKLPAAVKRGIADAALRLYTERNALRYDGLSRGVRMADVIELAHPKPKTVEQSALFRYLLDKRHKREGGAPPMLATIVMDEELRAVPEAERRDAFRAGKTNEAGWSWERLSGWLPGGMDAEAWEGIIPQMGYMALIRNLRNFDEAGVSDAVKAQVAARIAKPEAVAASRQFPYRFWSAYKNAPSLEWGKALEQALDLSCANIPALPGRTLVLIDISGSMQAGVSDRSKVMRYEIGALFGSALAKRTDSCDVALFADGPLEWPVKGSQSVLRYIESVGNQIGVVGYGTAIHESIRKCYQGHDRVVIFSDEASRDCYNQSVQLAIPVIHIFNLAGYRTATMPSGPGRFTYGGFTDATFQLMGLLEQGSEAGWPF